MEWKRVLLSKAFIAVLLALVAVNGFWFSYMRPDTWEDPLINGELYHEQLEKLSGSSWEEALQWCVSYREEAEEKRLNQQWNYDGPEEELYIVAQQLQEQYEYLLGYDDYLVKIETESKSLQSVSLFSDPNSTGYRNTVKTAGDFSALREITVTPGHDLAVTSFFEDKWTDYSILLLMFLVCGLLIAERKAGLWPMIHAAPGGRSSLAMTRIGILLAAAWISSVVLIGSKLFLCCYEYHGFGEWARMLQSIPMFGNVPTGMTVGLFWLLYIAVKALGAFWIGMMLWAVLSLISDLGLALCASGLLLGVEFVCTAIPSNSMFAVLRYVNVFSYVDFAPVFTRYLNIPVPGGLISGCDLVLAILPVLCVAFSVLNIIIMERKYPVAPTNRFLRWVNGIRKKLDPRLAGGGEARKLLLKRKGILVLLLMAAIVYQKEAPPQPYVDFGPFIQHYQQQYTGPITDEKLEEMADRLETINDVYNYQGLYTVLTDAQSAPEGSWILPTAPYDAVWSDNEDNYHRSTGLLALLVLVLVLAPIGSQERQDDMTVLLRSTPGGRKGLFLKKQLLIILLTLLVWGTVYCMEIYRTVAEYGAFTCLNAPVYSLKLFRWVPTGLSIFWSLVLYYGSKLVVLCVAGEVCFFLSNRCAKNRTATLLCCGILLIPAALASIGSAIGEYLSFLLPLSGSELLHLIS